MSACCNSVNKSNLQFSGHTFIYKQSVGDLTLAQFLKHVIIPQKPQVFHYKYSKLLIGGFRKKWNRSNTSTGARPDRKVRFILGELFDMWSWQPNDRKRFWVDGIESCCVGVRWAPVKASMSGVSLLQLSPFLASIFPLFPRNAWYSGYRFWDRYRGFPSQLLANFFIVSSYSPRSLCES